MIHSYRITKYNPQKRSVNGDYLDKDEWTNFSDIDIRNKNLLEKYLQIENAYIETIFNICNFLNVNILKIKKLELYKQDCNYVNGQSIQINELKDVVRMILREQIWCKLVSNYCEFHFGYDYYMYVISFDISLKTCAISKYLYIEDFASPYMNLDNRK